MTDIERISTATAWLAGFLIAAALFGIAWGGVMLRRRGGSRLLTTAQVTADLIGLGLALAAAFLAGHATLLAYRFAPVHLPLIWVLLGQVAAGLILSYMADSAFCRWLRQPLRAWFAGERPTGERSVSQRPDGGPSIQTDRLAQTAGGRAEADG